MMDKFGETLSTCYFTVNIYRPQRSWAKVMFLQVSVCPRGGGCLPQCMLGRQTPLLDQAHPPRPGAPPGSRHPLDQAPPGADAPWDQTPRSRHPPTRHTPTPPDQAPLQEQTPLPSRLQHTVYKWPVCILLECILVDIKKFASLKYHKGPVTPNVSVNAATTL